MSLTTAVFNKKYHKKQQSSENNKVDKANTNLNSSLQHINKHSYQTNDDTESNSNAAEIIDLKSITNISRDKDLRQDIVKQLIRQDDIIGDASNNVSSLFEMGDVFIKTREKNTNRRKNALE